MKTQKVGTWLPLFPGYYNTFLEPDETSEIEWYNEEHYTDFDFDDFIFNYDDYYNTININSCNFVEGILQKLNLIKSIKFEGMRSPKFYNFSNDAIDIEVEMSPKNMIFILDYLKEHKIEFSTYLLNHYKSRDGFLSSYSYNFDDWYNKESLVHSHKLGAILQFIIFNEEEEEELMSFYYEVAKIDAYISIELKTL